MFSSRSADLQGSNPDRLLSHFKRWLFPGNAGLDP